MSFFSREFACSILLHIPYGCCWRFAEFRSKESTILLCAHRAHTSLCCAAVRRRCVSAAQAAFGRSYAAAAAAAVTVTTPRLEK